MSEYNTEEYEEDYKSTHGDFELSLNCHCPYCNSYQNVINQIDWEDGHFPNEGAMNEYLCTDDCEIFIDCDSCKKTFKITSTSY